MKLKFKNQKFQSDAARAVVDVFTGQHYYTPSYLIDRGINSKQIVGQVEMENDFIGWSNNPINLGLENGAILDNIKKIQRKNLIEPSNKLEGKYNLTIEMETGVGKTYTYIKTMYELNKAYGWSKFIVVVPSVAIREGVYKTFQVTEEHFAEEYGKKIRYFIYNSANLTEIDNFASDNSIHVMIINSQAFNAKGKDARRIYMRLDEFRSRRPIDIIAKTNPIVIIDEPQSVEGKETKKRLLEFNPLMTLRYSATHKSDSIYNMVYRLDAMEAYNKKLVKKISVKGISEIGDTATNGYVYLSSINLSTSDPTATIEFDAKGKSNINKKSVKVGIGYNLYDNSNGLDEYKDGYIVSNINGYTNQIEFVNGIKLSVGEVIGKNNELDLRRIQIRETIKSHLEKEKSLFNKGIKVLSLFFIDEVSNYKEYDKDGNSLNGIYGDIFEEEYSKLVEEIKSNNKNQEYSKYLDLITPNSTHAGYFSIDKKGKVVNSTLGRKEESSNDVDAYDLIMKNKELLLDRNPIKSPVRFIFSHSALKEGWDNPNVFQICTLKDGKSEVRKRQEVGRGLRLCVNENGERMDFNVLGEDVHNVNVLTVIASESYDSFAKGLQGEIAEAIGNTPKVITPELFINKPVIDREGNSSIITDDMARGIYYNLIREAYIDKKGALTDKYYLDKENGSLKFDEDVEEFKDSILSIMDTIYDENKMKPENAFSNNIELKVDNDKLAMKEFKELWSKINSKTAYVVKFDSNELIEKAIKSLDNNLKVSKIYYKVESGTLEKINSKEELVSGNAFVKEKVSADLENNIKVNSNVRYDLIGKLVEGTSLTRKDIAQILKGIKKDTFNQFKNNPEEFILKATKLIESEKATAVIQHITYKVLEGKYSTSIFTEPTIKGRLDKNAIKTTKHLFDHLIYDSEVEKTFAQNLDTSSDVAVYVKLPSGFKINTPFGNYNPDWAIAFYEKNIKHIYFVAETKGSMDTLELRNIEKSKIHCAKEHFKAISNEEVKYGVVNSYDELISIVRK